MNVDMGILSPNCRVIKGTALIVECMQPKSDASVNHICYSEGVTFHRSGTIDENAGDRGNEHSWLFYYYIF